MHAFRQLGKKFPALVMLVGALWVLVLVDARAQEGAKNNQAVIKADTWQMPPKMIADAVFASRPDDKPNFNNMCPDGKKVLINRGDGMPTAERMGRPAVQLADIAIDHTAYRAYGLYRGSLSGYDLFFLADKRKVPVQLPPNTRVSNATWSPDGSQLAFFAHGNDATHIYIADATTGKSRQVTKSPVQCSFVTNFNWTRDGKNIQTVLLPEGSNGVPHNPPAGPKIRINEDKKAPSRTVRFLLETAEDMKLLEHLGTGQIALVDVNTGAAKRIGKPAMLKSVNMSPGGETFRVTVMKKPFSYYVTSGSFGTNESLWDADGKVLHTFSDSSLKEPGAGKGKGPKDPDPVDPVPPGPDDQKKAEPKQPPADPDAKRDMTWNAHGAGYIFMQLEPGPKGAKGQGPAGKGGGKGGGKKGGGGGGDAKKDINQDKKDVNQDKKDQDKKDQDKKDAKDQEKKEPQDNRKDRVMQWVPPYGAKDVKVVYETPGRIASALFSNDGNMLFVTETTDGQRLVLAIDLKDGGKKYVITKGAAPAGGGGDEELDDPFTPPFEEVWDADYYHGEQQKKGGKGDQPGLKGGGGAGSLLTRAGRGSARVVCISNDGEVYVAGTEKKGGGGGNNPRPTIEKINIKTGQKTRVFTGVADMLETIDSTTGDNITHVFTTRQNRRTPANSYLNDLATGKSEKLTEYVNNTEWFHDIKSETIVVEREDGFKFRVKITKGKDAKERQPAIFWIYPREYTNQAAYDKGKGGGGGGPAKGGAGTDGKFSAPGPRAMSIFTLLNFTIVEPDVPIVGPAGKMNDNYVKDLVSSLTAVVAELDKRNIIDPEKLVCGGHSYGAFSTANAMAHTKLFKAGIAGDGCYNRTLTPMSFQTEKRHIWDARDVYMNMSPFLHANQMSGALLMYHGAWDRNVGTHPMNADMMFSALRGLGKPAALYMYPYEDHGPAGRDTQLDMWARWVAWVDTYVVNPAPKKK